MVYINKYTCIYRVIYAYCIENTHAFVCVCVYVHLQEKERGHVVSIIVCYSGSLRGVN